VVTGREIEEDGDAVDLLLASDAWGLGDELERVWALVGGRREGGVRERVEPNLSKICFGHLQVLHPREDKECTVMHQRV
jgi:hypothetical protein